MDGVASAGHEMLSVSEQRLTRVARNIANVSTPGYKSVNFIEILESDRDSQSPSAAAHESVEFGAGGMIETGASFDLAISGAGFFAVKYGENIYLTRNGRFSRDANGHLVLGDGAVVQAAGGGDLEIGPAGIVVTSDATVVSDGVPIGRIAIVEPVDGAVPEQIGRNLFALPADAFEALERPVVRQGMIEASNVSLGEEMVEMMHSARQAETGQRIIQTYDQLLGRALSTFGQSGQ